MKGLGSRWRIYVQWTDFTSNFVRSNRLWHKVMKGFGSKSQGVAQSYRLWLKSDQFGLIMTQFWLKVTGCSSKCTGFGFQSDRLPPHWTGCGSKWLVLAQSDWQVAIPLDSFPSHLTFDSFPSHLTVWHPFWQFAIESAGSLAAVFEMGDLNSSWC